MTPTVFSDTKCTLGEGPLWHPERKQLFWFDIMERKLLTVEEGRERHWEFETYVSAAGWVDRDRMMVATARALVLFDLNTGAQTKVCDLEADDGVTRSNDGRADPSGGFWIGTMGVRIEKDAGAIYRWYRGELRKLYDNITVPNSICFSPGGDLAYWTDTAIRKIMVQSLDDEGWPIGTPRVLIDLTVPGVNPDGSVVDAEGRLWNAEWGTGRVTMYRPDGTRDVSIDLPASQTTCPAFGGENLTTMFVTSAAENLPDEVPAGKTFVVDIPATGQKEHRVIL